MCSSDLDLAVGDPDAVALLLPVMFVTGDFTQLFLEVDMIAAGLLGRLGGFFCLNHIEQ